MSGIKALGGLMTIVWIGSWFVSIWIGFFFGLLAGLAVFFTGVWALLVGLLCVVVLESDEREKKQKEQGF